MVTMTVHFNSGKLDNKELSVENILKKFNDYCEDCQILRPEVNVFEKDGEHAVADISKIIFDIERDKAILDLISEWFWIVDGQREDILADAYYWRNKLV